MKIGYWAQSDDDPAAEPAAMLGAASAEDAAAALAQRLIEQSEGEWLGGAIRVWDAKAGPGKAIVFDVRAAFVESEDEAGEYDCELEIVPRD